LNRFFQGFYFKQVSRDHALALIAAVGRDARGMPFASIQAVLPNATFTTMFPVEDARLSPEETDIRFDPNRLNTSGLILDLDGGGHSIRGALSFGPLSRPKGDIMGPFRFLPGMECRHRLISMAHEVRGKLVVDGQERDYDGALGYIEGDAGRSFPMRYLWTHCFAPAGEPRSVMLSVAEIPYAGRRFTGIIGSILLHEREIRLATYLGARVEKIESGRVSIRQRGYVFTASFDRRTCVSLQAPVDGGMTRAVHECLSGSARYILEDRGKTLFDFSSDNASFEYEYDR
jgi:hypothetical protein